MVFFATDWGYKYGGVNAFNIDLCKAVASLVNGFEVVCVVRAAPLEQIRGAKDDFGVRLVELAPNAPEGRHLTVPTAKRLTEKLASNNVLWWIGHDVVTGHWAFDAKVEFGGHVAIVHHMDYAAYKPLLQSDHAELIDEQNQLLCSADAILAVGPKLFSSARDKVSGRNGISVAEIIPGLPRVEPLKDPPSKFQAITMGRLEPRNNIIKQLPLAVDAFGLALRHAPNLFGPDPSLTVLGVSKADLESHHRELLAGVEKGADQAVPVQARAYEEDREKLLDIVRHHSVMMMLSRHEGFGLVAWEAIGAGIPLIVSKNSGVYQVIDRLFGGQGTGCLEAIPIAGSGEKPYYNIKDRGAVSAALCNIAMDQARAKVNALRLRASIEKLCTWQNAAATFCSALNVRTLSLLRWTPAFPNTVVNAATRSDLQFEALWTGLRAPSRFRRFVMLFGGISSALVDESALEHYAYWLTNNRDAELLICYEAGPSALARARELDPASIEPDATADLPRETEARMLMKEAKVRVFCDRLSRHLQDRGDGSAERFGFVAVDEPLTAYVMIADSDVFITPLLSKRSSESLSFLLANRPIQFPVDVLQYVVYNLEKLEQTGPVIRGLRYVNALIDAEYTPD